MPAILWAIFIYIICTLDFKSSNNHSTIIGIRLDKIAHFGLFLILSFTLCWGRAQQIKISKRFVILVFILSTVYGLMIEICQHYFTTTRQADIFDWIADSIGAICGIVLYLFVLKLKNLAKRL